MWNNFFRNKPAAVPKSLSSSKSNQGSEPDLQFDTPPRRATSNEMNKLNLLSKILVLLLIANIAIIAVIGIVYFTVMKKYVGAEVISANDVSPPKSAQEIKTTDNYFDSRVSHTSTLEGMSNDRGNGPRIIARDRWGGHQILDDDQKRPLVHPIKLVIIGHTASPMCMTFQQCTMRLQSIQRAHVTNNGYVGIGYNFLVGGDGNIYQALGWDIRNYLRNNSIQIQFVGNYGFDEVLETQRMAAQALLKRGVELGKLDKDYLLVGHNQVVNTESPGKFLKADIKNWPHYYNGILP